MKTEKIETLKTLGNEWQNHGKHRIYFDQEYIAKLYGLEFNRYNSGNISGAKLNGSQISNSQCNKTLNRIGKIYFDINENSWCAVNTDQEIFDIFVEKIKEGI